MLFSQPTVDLDEFESRSGWHLRPEGLCHADICVPVSSQLLSSGRVDLRIVGDTLGMPFVESTGLVALGPRASSHVFSEDARAPDVVLPDVNGDLFDLATLRGTKVLLLACLPPTPRLIRCAGRDRVGQGPSGTVLARGGRMVRPPRDR